VPVARFTEASSIETRLALGSDIMMSRSVDGRSDDTHEAAVSDRGAGWTAVPDEGL